MARAARTTLIVSGVAVVAPRAALADQTCAGLFTATQMASFPAPAIIGFDPGAAAPDQAALAKQFVAGMRATGARFDGTPTVQMDIAASVTPAGSNLATPQPGTYHGFGWAADSSAGAAPVVGGTLNLSVTLTNIAAAAIDWIGTITCTIRTNDKAALSRDIGERVGRALGSTFVNRRL